MQDNNFIHVYSEEISILSTAAYINISTQDVEQQYDLIHEYPNLSSIGQDPDGVNLCWPNLDQKRRLPGKNLDVGKV